MTEANLDKMRVDGIASGRLDAQTLASNFADLHAPLTQHEAQVEAERCYYCYDAPCMTACPTSIDIPQFIREISTGNEIGAAETILEQNILGGMCARVCPTENLCEQVCVREEAEGKPVKIGQLQRFATDAAMAQNKHFFERAAETGKKVAVVGAGPAGLACAHRLSMHGHDVTMYDAREKAGGLNEFGIATYKSVDDFAQREVDYVLSIGGIETIYGQKLGETLSLDTLEKDFDAVFLAIGTGGVNALRAQGEDVEGVSNATDFIAKLRQTPDLSTMEIGRNVVVIGGGMTAIDAAVQAKLLGAETVNLCYRRGQEHMNASDFEQELAASKGVHMHHWVQPKAIHSKNGHVTELELEFTKLEDGKLCGAGATMTIPADQIFKAIGQTLDASSAAGLDLENGRIAVDQNLRSSRKKVWAGGDCIAAGDDLTVTAVAQGRDAAENIHKTLMG